MISQLFPIVKQNLRNHTVFLPCAAKPKKKETALAVSLKPSKKWQSHFFERDPLRSAPWLSAYSGQLDARSVQSVFCHAHVAAENRFYIFHVRRRKTLQGFFSVAYLPPRTAANMLLLRTQQQQCDEVRDGHEAVERIGDIPHERQVRDRAGHDDEAEDDLIGADDLAAE